VSCDSFDVLRLVPFENRSVKNRIDFGIKIKIIVLVK